MSAAMSTLVERIAHAVAAVKAIGIDNDSLTSINLHAVSFEDAARFMEAGGYPRRFVDDANGGWWTLFSLQIELDDVSVYLYTEHRPATDWEIERARRHPGRTPVLI